MLKSITDAARRSIASAIESIANAIPVPPLPGSQCPEARQDTGGGLVIEVARPYGLTYIQYPGERHERER